MGTLSEALRRGGVHDVRDDETLAGHTTLKVGGPAAAYARVDSTAELAVVARVCREHAAPWLVIGRGSNVLITDAGWPGVVVELGRGFRGVTVVEEADAAIGDTVVVNAGAAEPMPVLASTVARLGLAGLAFGVAIPGSVGGAVRMNAGAHGRQMRDVLVDIDVVRLDDGGRVDTVSVDALQMAYRSTQLPPDAVVVAARLGLERADGERLAADMAEMRRWRREHQPINSPSCGSVFRNPEGDSAGRLIEAAGLKGLSVGGAHVSDVHANFITTRPGASAQDVFDVITTVRDAVAKSAGVTLQTEVVLVGFDDTPAQAATARRGG